MLSLAAVALGWHKAIAFIATTIIILTALLSVGTVTGWCGGWGWAMGKVLGAAGAAFTPVVEAIAPARESSIEFAASEWDAWRHQWPFGNNLPFVKWQAPSPASGGPGDPETPSQERRRR